MKILVRLGFFLVAIICSSVHAVTVQFAASNPITDPAYYTNFSTLPWASYLPPTGAFGVYTSAVVMTADSADQAFGAPFIEIQNVPDDVLGYLLPSRYCESDRFHQMATEITAAQSPGYNQVPAIVSWLRNNISFRPGSSDIPVSAAEVNSRQVGVCRDLAHQGIALCRSLSVPARMVVGYLY